MRSAAFAALYASSDARSTPLRWSGSSSRRCRATAGSTRSRTVMRNSPARPAWQEDPGELPRAGGPEHPPERRVALVVPPALSQRRAFAGICGHEQRVPAYPPGARPAARREVRLYVLPGRAELLPVPGPDRHRRLPDVLLRPVGDPGVLEHPVDPERGGLRAADPQHPSLGHPPDGLLRLP